VESADLIPDGWRDWLRWNQVCDERRGRPPHPETELLASVDGRLLGFSRLVARKAELADNAWPWW
jgi:hypothetical protein